MTTGVRERLCCKTHLGFQKQIFVIIFVVWNPFWACHFFCGVCWIQRSFTFLSCNYVQCSFSSSSFSWVQMPSAMTLCDIRVRNGHQCLLRHPGTWVQTLYEYFLLFTYHQTDLYFCVKCPNVWNSQWQNQHSDLAVCGFLQCCPWVLIWSSLPGFWNWRMRTRAWPLHSQFKGVPGGGMSPVSSISIDSCISKTY